MPGALPLGKCSDCSPRFTVPGEFQHPTTDSRHEIAPPYPPPPRTPPRTPPPYPPRNRTSPRFARRGGQPPHPRLNNKTPAVATDRLVCAPPCVCAALCVHRLACEPPTPPPPPPPPYLPPVHPHRTRPPLTSPPVPPRYGGGGQLRAVYATTSAGQTPPLKPVAWRTRAECLGSRVHERWTPALACVRPLAERTVAFS